MTRSDRIRHLLSLALIVVSVILIFAMPDNAKVYFFIPLIVGIALSAWLIALTNRRNKEPGESEKKRSMDHMSGFFFTAIYAVVGIMLLVGIWGAYELRDQAFRAVALAIIVIWACIFVAYFIWAVYFYNVNMGLTQEEWDRIDEAKEKKRSGQFYSEEDLQEEPRGNPNHDQTFGLPPGTVRGMIAFTLLFGAISTLILSIGMEDCLECQSTFRDQFDFFKNAFLMMIAFYFGSRSLEILQGKTPGGTNISGNPAPAPAPAPVLTGLPAKPDPGTPVPPINPMDPKSPPAPQPPPSPAPVQPATGKPDQDEIVFIDPMK